MRMRGVVAQHRSRGDLSDKILTLDSPGFDPTGTGPAQGVRRGCVHCARTGPVPLGSNGGKSRVSRPGKTRVPGTNFSARAGSERGHGCDNQIPLPRRRRPAGRPYRFSPFLYRQRMRRKRFTLSSPHTSKIRNATPEGCAPTQERLILASPMKPSNS